MNRISNNDGRYKYTDDDRQRILTRFDSLTGTVKHRLQIIADEIGLEEPFQRSIVSVWRKRLAKPMSQNQVDRQIRERACKEMTRIMSEFLSINYCSVETAFGHIINFINTNHIVLQCEYFRQYCTKNSIPITHGSRTCEVCNENFIPNRHVERNCPECIETYGVMYLAVMREHEYVDNLTPQTEREVGYVLCRCGNYFKQHHSRTNWCPTCTSTLSDVRRQQIDHSSIVKCPCCGRHRYHTRNAKTVNSCNHCTSKYSARHRTCRIRVRSGQDHYSIIAKQMEQEEEAVKRYNREFMKKHTRMLNRNKPKQTRKKQEPKTNYQEKLVDDMRDRAILESLTSLVEE